MEKLKFKKRLLNSSSSFIVFDIGTSLIKSIYVDQEDDHYNIDTQKDDIIFTCRMREVSRGIDEMIANIKVRKSNLKNVESKLVLLSGVKCERFESRIRECLMIEVKIISEMEAIAKGVRYIIDEGNTHFIYAPEVVEPLPIRILSESMEKYMECWKRIVEVDESENQIFPIIYINIGDVTRFILINENGNGKEISYNTFGGKTFLGLAKCLIDENNFSVLTSSAERGDRCNVDTQFKEAFLSDELSYAQLPPDLPIIPFGKAAELRNEERLPYSKEDILHSLVNLLIENCVFFGCRLARITRCKSIYVGGNLFQHKVFRIQYAKFLQQMPEMITYNFIKGGMETAIGLTLNQ